jgi:Protein kinase domain
MIFLGDDETEKRDAAGLVPVSRKYISWYTDPTTGIPYKISLCYKLNEKDPLALENQLLQLEDIDERYKLYEQLLSRELESNVDKLLSWPRVAGIDLHTDDNGTPQWKYSEDEDEKLTLIPDEEIPSHIPRIEVSELTDVEYDDPIYKVNYNGQTHVVKVSETAGSKGNYCAHFDSEVHARIKIGNAPHISKMVGVVMHNSSVDGKRYVQGILLEYYIHGISGLRYLLEHGDTPVEDHIKRRWISQIAHGVQLIHAAGVMHGDLCSFNIVADENYNAYII